MIEPMALALVLLPQAELEARIIDWNKTLRGPDGESKSPGGRSSGTIVLGAGEGDARAHLTLAMGVGSGSALPALRESMMDIARGARPVVAEQATLVNRQNSRTGSVVWLAVNRSRQLVHWHEEACALLKATGDVDATQALFHDNAKVSDGARSYVATYRRKAGGDQFQPHVTVGYGQIADTSVGPSPFIFDRIALAQIGPHCTMYIRQEFPLGED